MTISLLCWMDISGISTLHLKYQQHSIWVLEVYLDFGKMLLIQDELQFWVSPSERDLWQSAPLNPHKHSYQLLYFQRLLNSSTLRFLSLIKWSTILPTPYILAIRSSSRVSILVIVSTWFRSKIYISEKYKTLSFVQ